MDIVKVRYYSESSGETISRDYTYFSEVSLQVGDMVIVPVNNTEKKARVTAINVPEKEIASFRDKVKTIPAGSVINEIEPAPELKKVQQPVKLDSIDSIGQKANSLVQYLVTQFP